MANLLLDTSSWNPNYWSSGREAYYRAFSTDMSMAYAWTATTSDSLAGRIRGITGGTMEVFVNSNLYYSLNFGAGLSSFAWNIPVSGLVNIVITGNSNGEIEMIPDAVTPPGPGPGSGSNVTEGYYVYELDRGWTFDGMYIPHFIIFNWYFGENPTVYTTMQKIRVHGLAKGIANLQVQTNGIQTDYREDFTGAEQFTFKSPYEFVSEEFISATNYADLANRGLAIQLKFQGSNTNALLPEPAHVLQVLIPQSSPDGSGFTSN